MNYRRLMVRGGIVLALAGSFVVSAQTEDPPSDALSKGCTDRWPGYPTGPGFGAYGPSQPRYAMPWSGRYPPPAPMPRPVPGTGWNRPGFSGPSGLGERGTGIRFGRGAEGRGRGPGPVDTAP